VQKEMTNQPEMEDKIFLSVEEDKIQSQTLMKLKEI
jgi:predicted RNA-binding protein